MSALTRFERQVLGACLAGSDPRLQVLQAQLDVATESSREHTGVGAYVNFSVPAAVATLDAGTIVIGDVNQEVRGVPLGVATLLYVYDGRLQFLELATYDGEWPEDPEIIGMGYLQEVQRGADAFTLVPVGERHADTLARALKGRESQGA